MSGARAAEPPRLGLIAGAGTIPRAIAEAALAQGRRPFVVALSRHTDPATVSDLPHAWMALGAASAILRRLGGEGVEEVCLVGAVRRPSWRELRPDWLVLREGVLRRGLRGGDNAVLTRVAALLEARGMRLVGAHQILPSLLAAPGLLGACRPDDADGADIALGLRVARLLGEADVGQAVVVQQGMVLALEAIEGTDALIDRGGTVRRRGRGPLLVKVPKPGQDHRLDVPTIGPRTVERAAAAGFRGIAVAAGATLIAEPQTVRARADAAGLFVTAVNRSGDSSGDAL